jgi:predicted  nucleic acid-binding Zn-ribbon protein
MEVSEPISEAIKTPVERFEFCRGACRTETFNKRMLTLHKQLGEVKTDHEKTLLERQIEATDKQIDALVYELYGLTEEEIRIVEAAGT